jgi:DNA-binding NarL/FixJ family response regulator
VSDQLRVLVADDHAPTRAGVALALERGGCEVCAEAANADDAIAAAIAERPDVCVIDLDMPGSGIRAVGEITAQLPGTRVVVLTVSSAPDDLFDAVRAGAAGYMLKDMDPAELPELVRRLARGEGALPGVLIARLFEQLRSRGSGRTIVLDDGRRVELTPREQDVLELLADETPTAEIAARLFLSPVTVRRHVSTLLHKLDVRTRREAADLLARRTNDRRAS